MEVYITILNQFNKIDLYIKEDSSLILSGTRKIQYPANTFLKKLLPIISNWTNKKPPLILKDAESYEITIIDNDKKTNLYGKSYYHLNYKDFKKLISEVIR